MSRVTIVLVQCLLFCLGTVFSGFAGTAPVTGTVTDSNGSPVAHVVVVATDNEGNTVGKAVTNAQGEYSMVLPLGKKYTLALEPPAPFETPPPAEIHPLLAASGAVVNVTVEDPSGKALVAAGVVTIASSAGAAVGAASSDKKVASPSN